MRGWFTTPGRFGNSLCDDVNRGHAAPLIFHLENRDINLPFAVSDQQRSARLWQYAIQITDVFKADYFASPKRVKTSLGNGERYRHKFLQKLH